MSVEVFDKSRRRGRILRYAPLVLWIAVILYFSSGQGSMSETSRFIRPVLEFLFPAASEETLLFYHGYIRKFAHLAGYAFLAFFAARAFFSSPAASLARYWHLFSLGIVILVAVADETNQSFISSRTSSAGDVLLDISGAAAMLICILLFHRMRPFKYFFWRERKAS